MALVTVTINGYPHSVGCEAGQEPHLLAMAADVEQRVHSIKALGGQTGEARLLVLAALMLADEVHDLREELAAAKATQGAARAPDAKLHRRLTKLAARAEEIALDLEHP
jgi:cell division protein ZapA